MAKVYNNGTWEDCIPRVLKDGTDTLTTLPAKIYTNDLVNKTVTLDISGNTVQNGTPTPDTPVAVEGCGTLDNGRYKIPVTLGSQTQDIYFDTTTTTRRIKKLVLTGAEKVTDLGDYYDCGVTISSTAWRLAVSTIGGGVFTASNNGRALWAKKSSFPAVTTAAAFKSYLADQYAAGTPVTVWYVLTEPETTTVNEPLMKIDNYADTVSLDFDNVTPGEKEISVNTTVQPSSVAATHYGWHEQQELIRQNDEWTTPNTQQLSALQSPLSFSPIDEDTEETEEIEEGGEEHELER